MNIHRALTLILAVTALLHTRAKADGAPTDGLIHQWHFDEGKGTTAYDSIGSWNFTLYNGAAFTDSGLKSSGIQLDGVNDYAATPTSDISFLKGNFTFSIWFLFAPGTPPAATELVEMGDTYLDISSNGAPSLNSKFGYSVRNLSSINDQSWHLLSIVSDTMMEAFYIDGRNIGSTKIIPNSITGTFSLSHPVQYKPSGGQIDEVSVYNRALSPAEIAQAAAVPEPSAALLFMGALGAFLPRRRHVRSAKE